MRKSEMRAAIPIIGQIEVAVSRAERARLKLLAEKRIADEPHLSSITRFGPRVRTGIESGPALLIDDQSEIALSGTPEEGLFEYRLALLADSDDILVLSGDRCPDFERYLSRLLGIGRLDVLIARNPNPGQRCPMPRRCAEQRKILQHIAEVAHRAGRLSIIPNVATGHVWNLAQKIAEISGAKIFIAGPPPRLSRQVNDKLWFAERVREVFGREAHPPSYSAFGPAALAARVRDLSRDCQRVVIKVPDSAGSAGNLVLDSEGLRHMRLAELRSRLSRLLTTFGSGWTFPLMVEVWEGPIVSSPSVQIWIPHPEESLPVVEGLFEQTIEADKGEFVGATRIHLPPEWREQIARQASHLAIFLQELDYFGRCSFDSVIVGSNYDKAKLHWIECNGRWGGVSIPMTLSNRLGPAASNSEIAIVQRTKLDVTARPFRDVLSLLGDMLFTSEQGHGGVIPLTPAGFERGAGVHFMTIADSLDRAKDTARRALELATGC
jgi:hypothetical protein